MISVIIPALNEEKYLPDCLKSLRNQDYSGPYEIIIADNGSADNTVRIAHDFNARVVPCPEKKSVFYARQIGADAAQGDIIAQADADTLYPATGSAGSPNALKNIRTSWPLPAGMFIPKRPGGLSSNMLFEVGRIYGLFPFWDVRGLFPAQRSRSAVILL